MKKQKLINIILGFVTTFALLLNYMEIYNKGLSAVKSIISVSPIIASIVLIAIIVFYDKFNKNEYKTNWLQKIISLFFAIVMLVGKSFEELNSWDMITKNKLTMLVALIGICGYFVFFDIVFKFINYIITKININNTDNGNNNKLLKIFDQKPFTVSIVCMLIFWTIYIFAFYPGILNPDSSYQILQALNIHTKYSDWVIQLDTNVNITNHHPVLYTLILGSFLKFGKLLINDNFGIFLSTILQVTILSSTLAYTIKYLKNINISLNIRLVILIIYCIVPMYAFYSVTLVKDVIYTALIILYIINLYDFVKNYKNKSIPLKKIFEIFIVILLISLFRNNGSYVVILSLIPAIFYSKKNIKKMASLLILFIIINYCYTNVVLPFFKISNTSIRETLSVPFQQTARYVKYYSDELSWEDIEVIDKILGYDTLAQRYNPQLADPVKNEYNKYATKEDLKNYFKVWLKCFIKHPDCYVQAFINNTYGYFYPTNKGWYLYYNKKDIVNEKGNIDYHYNDCKLVRKYLVVYGNIFRNIPFVGLLSNIGFNTCVILIYSVYFITKKGKRRYLIVLLPHLISILVCLVSPVNNYFRYAMPYIFAMPITTIIFFKEITKKGEEDG